MKILAAAALVAALLWTAGTSAMHHRDTSARHHDCLVTWNAHLTSSTPWFGPSTFDAYMKQCDR